LAAEKLIRFYEKPGNMKLFNTTILAAWLIILLAACQKEINIDLSPKRTTAIDSNYLQKFLYIEKTAGIVDTTDSWIYVYDNLKRVTSLYDSTSDPASEQIRWDYFYSGTDTLPYKSIRRLWGSSIEDTTVTFHFYINGINARDSVLDFYRSLQGAIYQTSKKIKNYSYTAGKIIGFSVLTYFVNPLSNPISYFKDTALLDINGNMLQCNEYEANSAASSAYRPFIFSTITYDNHPSPFNKLSNVKCFGVFPKPESFLEEFPQVYNQIYIHQNIYLFSSQGSSFEQDYTNQYIYKLNGYPQEIFSFDPGVPGDYSKIAFIYKSL
jgi:hypothetical protein